MDTSFTSFSKKKRRLWRQVGKWRSGELGVPLGGPRDSDPTEPKSAVPLNFNLNFPEDLAS